MTSRLKRRMALALAAFTALAIGGQAVEPQRAAADTQASAATRILGPTRSGLPWHSGVWLGGRFTPADLTEFARWRGRPADVVTTFAAKSSYRAMTQDLWSLQNYSSFPGKLTYALPILPDSGEGSLGSIAAGEQDQVWRSVAQNLTSYGRGDSIVRVAWESNIDTWRWRATASNASVFKAAFQRVVTVMRGQAPNLKFEFGTNCGGGLEGSSDRLAPLTAVYPGDDVVDLVGCDIYDWWGTHAYSDSTWGSVLHPGWAPGIEDVTNFARAHGKGAAFGEWGLAKSSSENHGGGDNPYFIRSMFQFFAANQDVVAYESYFDEPTSGPQNSFGSLNFQQSAYEYSHLW